MAHFAKYTEGPDGTIFRDGHSMFSCDVVRDLNRKSYLEERQTPEAVVRLNDLLSAIALREDNYKEMLDGDIMTLDRRDYYTACMSELGWVKSELGL